MKKTIFAIPIMLLLLSVSVSAMPRDVFYLKWYGGDTCEDWYTYWQDRGYIPQDIPFHLGKQATPMRYSGVDNGATIFLIKQTKKYCMVKAKVHDFD